MRVSILDKQRKIKITGSHHSMKVAGSLISYVLILFLLTLLVRIPGTTTGSM